MPAGILLDDLRPEHQKAAMDLAELCLSASGNKLLRKSMLVNQAMGEIFNFYTDTFREFCVWFTIFGDPSTGELWGWQLMGTHIDINCTVVGDNESLEPLFLGAELTEIDQGPYEGLSVYGAEQDAGLAFLRRTITRLAKGDRAAPQVAVRTDDRLELIRRRPVQDHAVDSAVELLPDAGGAVSR